MPFSRCYSFAPGTGPSTDVPVCFIPFYTSLFNTGQRQQARTTLLQVSTRFWAFMDADTGEQRVTMVPLLVRAFLSCWKGERTS